MTRRGLTLLELIVGLTITAMAATTGAGAIGVLLDRRTTAADAVRQTVHATGVRRTISTWLEGVRLIPGDQGRSFQLIDRTTRGLPDDELTFVTTAPTPVGGENVVVRLYVERDARAPQRGLVAELRDWSGMHGARVALDSTVTRLDVRCRTSMFGPPRWLTGWLSAGLLPRGVEIRLGATGDASLDPLLRVPLTVAFPGGQ